MPLPVSTGRGKVSRWERVDFEKDTGTPACCYFATVTKKIYRRIAERFREVRMKNLSVIMGVLAGLGAIGVAEAAVLEPLRGNVRVSHGGGYLAVRAATN